MIVRTTFPNIAPFLPKSLLFHPSLSYHVSQKYNGLIELIPYHKEIQPTSDALFYYTTSDEKDQLGSKYKVISEYAWKTRVLLKLK